MTKINVLAATFAKFLRHSMAIAEHLMKAKPDDPPEQQVDHAAAAQSKIYAVGQARFSAHIFKLMSVDPSRKGSIDLFVHEQPAFLIGPVHGDPGEHRDTKFGSRARADAARSRDHAHSREFRRKERQRVVPLMEREHDAHRCCDQDAPGKNSHSYAILPGKVGLRGCAVTPLTKRY
jgi:hypothetical protein